MRPINEIMTEDEFVRHAMRVMKLFKPIQPTDEEYLVVRMQDDVPGDVFVQLAMKMEEMVETAGQMLELMHVRPEGSA